MKIKNLAIVLLITALLLSIPCASAVNLDNNYDGSDIKNSFLKDLSNDKTSTINVGMKIFIIKDPKFIKPILDLIYKIKPTRR